MVDSMKALALALLLIGCDRYVVLPPVNPVPNPPGDGSQCAKTCEHWRKLSCVEGEPSEEENISCEDRCKRAEEFEADPHECIQEASSCDDARRCSE